MHRQTFYEMFVLASFIFLLWQFFHVLSPFITPLFLAWVLWVVSLPMDKLFGKRIKNVPLRALTTTTAVLAIFVIPIILLTTLFVSELRTLLPRLQQTVVAIKTWAQNPTWDHWPIVGKLMSTIDRYPAIPRPDLNEKISDLASTGLNLVTHAGGAVAASTATLLGYTFVILLTLFFLFKDGRTWTNYIVDLIPLRKESKDRIGHTLYVTVADIVRGSFLTSLVQTAIAVVGYWACGVQGAITLGLATGVASCIPAIGSGLVWVPVAAYMLMKGSVAKFIGVLILGAIVSSSDNIIRTFFIGQAIQAPVLLMFLALIGGVLVHGALGLLIGPIIIAVLPLFAQIYKEVFFRGHATEA